MLRVKQDTKTYVGESSNKGFSVSTNAGSLSNVSMSYNHVGNFKTLSKAGKNAVWNTLGTLSNLLPDSSKSTSTTTKSAISDGTIEVLDANFNMQTLSRDTKDSLNKLDEIFDKKRIEERQELSKLFAKEKPDVAQSLSALLGAAVNGSLGYSPVTGVAEAQYGTKWNQLSDGQIEYLKSAILQNLDNNGSVEELIRILENGATLGYVQEAGNPSSRKNADGSYTTRAEGAMYADDMFLGVKGLGTRITNKLGINYHVTLMEKDISLGTTIILDEMATLARAKYSNGSNNEKIIFVDTSDKVSVMPVSESKSTFVWTKDALGKSVAQNDYQMYSGRELAKAWSANLIPVGLGIGGGFVGGLAAGPAGAFAIGVTGATLGDRVKDEIKFNLKKDVDK